MPVDRPPAARGRRRRLVLLGVAALVALTAFSWWLSGRWLARPEPPPASRSGGRAIP